MKCVRFAPVVVGICLTWAFGCAIEDAGRGTGGTKGSGGTDPTTGSGGATTGTGAGGDPTGAGGATGTGGSTTTGTGGATTTTGAGGATTTTGAGGATTTTGAGGATTTTGTGGAAGTGGATTTTGVGGTAGATTGAGGTGTAGTGGGTTVDAGSKGGASGAGGGTTVDAGGGGPLIDVARPLNGFMMIGLCLRDTEASVCATTMANCPGANTADPALSGVLTTDKTVTLGGTMGTPYSITLHVQGEVESKQYGGMDQNATLASPTADGFCVGGTPTAADAYNVYLVRVTNPGSTAKTDYFLNSLQRPGVSNHTTYGIDYTAKIQAQGGATIRLVAADANCSMIKNCGPEVSGTTCRAPITMTGIEPQGISLNPTFDFTKPYNGQWIVMTVKDVTSP